MKRLLTLCCALLLAGCGEKGKNGDGIPVHNPEFPHAGFLTASAAAAYPNNPRYYYAHKQAFAVDNNFYFAACDANRNTPLYIFSLPGLDSVASCGGVGSLRPGKRVVGMDIHHFDSIYVLYRDRTVVLTDTAFRLLREWKITATSEDYGDGYVLTEPFRVEDGILYARHLILASVPQDDPNRRVPRGQTRPIIQVDLDHPDSITAYYGKPPVEYLIHHYQFQFPEIAIHQGRVLTTFDMTDSVYIDNCPVACVRSNHHLPPQPFDESRYRDQEYVSQWEAENGNYGRLLRDPWKGQWYWMYYWGIPYDNGDGTFNTVRDAPKSVLVLDDGFNVLKEVVLPSSYFIYDSHITPYGLMIKDENREEGDTIRFDFFNL